MLTDVDDRSAPMRKSIRVDVGSVVVRLALSYVTEEHGWALCAHDDRRCGCLRVVDTRRAGTERVEVIITRDTPSDCQAALDRVLAGTVGAVVLWDDPAALTAAIGAIEHRSALIPERVIRLANDAPRLRERQRRTLELLAAGRSNRDISLVLRQSVSTTKRDVAELLCTFDVANRTALLTAASRLGFAQTGV